MSSPRRVAAPGSPVPKVLETTEDPKEFLALLECPVCYDTMLPQIMSCSNGHNICQRCHQQVSHCPVCRSPMSKLRNAFLEKTIESCRLICQYHNLGCDKDFYGSQLRSHESKCDYREICCICCNQNIPYDKFVPHLIHGKEVVVTSETGEYRTSFYVDASTGITNCPPFIWLKCFDRNFFLQIERRGDTWWVYVTMYGAGDDHVNWHCELMVVNVVGQTAHVYNGSVNPIRTRSGDALKASRCITFNASQFLKTERFLNLNLRIMDRNDPVYRDRLLPPNWYLTPQEYGWVGTPCAPPPDLQGQFVQAGVTYQHVAVPMIAIVAAPVFQNRNQTGGDTSQTRGRFVEVRPCPPESVADLVPDHFRHLLVNPYVNHQGLQESDPVTFRGWGSCSSYQYRQPSLNPNSALLHARAPTYNPHLNSNAPPPQPPSYVDSAPPRHYLSPNVIRPPTPYNRRRGRGM